MQVYKAIISVLKECKAIGKNQKNTTQGYKFRGIDDFYNEMHELFGKYELFVVPQILDLRREERAGKNGGMLLWTVLRVKYTFIAPDGSKVEAETIGEAMDSGDKGANKAMSAALKYLLTQTFLVPTEDLEDADKSTHEPKAVTQKETKITRQAGGDLGGAGYEAMLDEVKRLYVGLPELVASVELAVTDGIYNEESHVSYNQVLVDMFKKRNVTFSLKNNKIHATQLTQAVYESVLEVVTAVREKLEQGAKVA